MAQKRVFSQNGLNIPASQFTNIDKMAHQTIIIPQTSTPAWGAYFTIDLKEKKFPKNNYLL